MFSLNKDTRILITGGTGFVGGHLVEYLAKQGYMNIHVTHLGSNESIVHQLIDSQHIHRVDLTQDQQVNDLWKTIQPEAIFHLASLSSVGNSFNQVADVLQNNTQLQVRILEAMKKSDVASRLLAISSGEVYGKTRVDEQPIAESQEFRPVNPYAVSKVTQDVLAYMYGETSNLDIVRVRPFNHTGARQSPDFVISSYAKQIAEIEAGKRQTVEVGNLEASRDFSDVSDIVRAYVVLMQSGTKSDVYNVGSGQAIKIHEILDILISLAKSPIATEQVQNRMRPSDVPIAVADISKIRKLGWEPTVPLNETLQKVLDYWRTQV